MFTLDAYSWIELDFLNMHSTLDQVPFLLHYSFVVTQY